MQDSARNGFTGSRQQKHGGILATLTGRLLDPGGYRFSEKRALGLDPRDHPPTISQRGMTVQKTYPALTALSCR
jgi:hypothetical protein